MDLTGYIWMYLVGPIVADAHNSSTATWNGIVAHTGYNPVNTVTWALISALVLYTIYRVFRSKDVEFDAQTVLYSLPFILLGGILRFVEDTGQVPPKLSILLITPVIYVLLALFYLGVLAIAEDYREKRDLFLVSVGTLFLLPPTLYTLIYLKHHMMNAGLLLSVPIAIGMLIPTYGLIRDSKIGNKTYYLAAFSQFFGGAVSMLSLSNGYQQKQLLAQTATQYLGPVGILVVKTALVAIAFYVLMDVEDEEVEGFVLLALVVIGLATGLRVLLRGLTGL
ncbi:MAG: DUF63 family protein [Candidatus Nanohaloarchaea archaeon]